MAKQETGAGRSEWIATNEGHRPIMKDLKQHPSTMDPDVLGNHALEVLDIIVAEFENDPMSVQCFDLRVVERAKALVTEHRRRQRNFERGPLQPRPAKRFRR